MSSRMGAVGAPPVEDGVEGDRHLLGQTVGSGFEHVGEVVHPLLDAGLTSLEEYR